MNCPRCAKPLAQVGTERQADACPAGHGAYLRRDEILRLLGEDDGGRLLRAVHGSVALSIDCPAEDDRMRTIRIASEPSFEVDGCPRCRGFWFDAGEAERLQAEGVRIGRQVAGFDPLGPGADPYVRAAWMGAAGYALFATWRDL